MRLPDFLIIGGARCGTTTLYELLKKHPKVFLPPNKRPEPHFFLRAAEYGKGLAYYSRKYFTGAKDYQIVGEASTSYVCHPYVAERILECLPKARLITMLRNPIERAFSHYMVSLQSGLETMSFSDAIRNEDERISHPGSTFERESLPFGYVFRGRYYRQLGRYLELFPRSQLQIVVFEDFVEDMFGQLGKVLSFLSLNEYPPVQADCLKSNAGDYGSACMLESDRRYLREVFYEDIKALEGLLERDLSFWR